MIAIVCLSSRVTGDWILQITGKTSIIQVLLLSRPCLVHSAACCVPRGFIISDAASCKIRELQGLAPPG